jgi:nitrate reductase molybdenum cofactor assembly chaperone NarJ/NarW
MNTETYDLLAKLLGYPDDETKSALARCRCLVSQQSPDAGAALDRFVEATASMTTEEQQELYTRTFDLNPTCSLEVGWQLYGENYARGEFLVAMRQTLRRLGIEESTELPDHLTHALAALGRMQADEATRFVTECLLPSIKRMLEGLNGKNCPYAGVLEATCSLMGLSVHASSCHSSIICELPMVPPEDDATSCQPESSDYPLPAVNCQLPTEEEVCHG